jgi:hypothetical protein
MRGEDDNHTKATITEAVDSRAGPFVVALGLVWFSYVALGAATSCAVPQLPPQRRPCCSAWLVLLFVGQPERRQKMRIILFVVTLLWAVQAAAE